MPRFFVYSLDIFLYFFCPRKISGGGCLSFSPYFFKLFWGYSKRRFESRYWGGCEWSSYCFAGCEQRVGMRGTDGGGYRSIRVPIFIALAEPARY